MKNLEQVNKELTKIDEKLARCGNMDRCSVLQVRREALLRLKANLERTTKGADELEN